MSVRARLAAAALTVGCVALSGCGVHIKGINDWDMRAPDQARHAYAQVLDRTGPRISRAHVWRRAVSAASPTGRLWAFHDGTVEHGNGLDASLDRVPGQLFDAAAFDPGAYRDRCDPVGEEFRITAYPGPDAQRPYVRVDCSDAETGPWLLDGAPVPARDVWTREGWEAAWRDFGAQSGRVLVVQLGNRDGLEVTWVGRCGTRFCGWETSQGPAGLGLRDGAVPDYYRPTEVDPDLLWRLVEGYARRHGLPVRSVEAVAALDVRPTSRPEIRYRLSAPSSPSCAYSAAGEALAAGPGLDVTGC